ncbi:MAG: DUF4388 domain-containing protein [Thermoanaerobaculia bacterium]
MSESRDAALDLPRSLLDHSLPEALKSVLEARRTGTLTMTRPGEEIHLFFESGELRTAVSTAAGRRLGDALRREGIVSDAALESALEELRAEGHGRLGRHLLDRGLITEEALHSATQRHFEEIAMSAFSWDGGQLQFHASNGRLDPVVAFPLSIAAVLVVGMRQAPESERFVELLGDLDRFAAAAAASVNQYETLRLEPAEAYLLSLCDGTTPLRAILKLAPSPRGAARTLYTLEITGLVEFLDGPLRPNEAEPSARAGAVWSRSSEPDEDARSQVARGNYLEARRLLERRDYYGAIVLLQESVRLAPENSEYHFRLAGGLAKNASWRAKATAHYNRAFQLDPFRQDVMREYGEFLSAGGQHREAQAIVRRLVQRYPDEPLHQELLAKCDQAVHCEETGEDASPTGKRSLLSRIWSRRSPE